MSHNEQSLHGVLSWLVDRTHEPGRLARYAFARPNGEGVAGRTDKLIEPHLQPGEKLDAALRGLVAGYTRWSTIGSIIAVLVTYTLVMLFRLNLLASLVALLAAIVFAFVAMLYLVGRPMASRNEPALNSPYVALALTNKRMMLIEQGTGKEISFLVEESLRSQITHLDYARGSVLVPQRLSYRTSAGERRFEFPRMERVAQFAEALKG